ncbi:hypothetical protein PFICI_15168 [Pestalotiopsis fici W106-1]|uniref:Uncharacterized protein n=1 Tax=Pestalotiopsis fici (strain W106-1 / CGMCC3.15140) TaxID=1229662 RepID=W3WH73_PESFW|nr:uncharacterized protein PFICI_15168 [Pestalotiopsis fici W106-1]ETS73223.1 hypothetical protein PFICI_15168 [Pestalotiopsis fici W106-1]
MDLDSVNALVAALVSNYQDGVEFYAKWQRRNWQENHYGDRAKGKQASSGSGGCCGMSASLNFSAHRIREAFDKGTRILGQDFSVGDGMRDSLLSIYYSSIHSTHTLLHSPIHSELDIPSLGKPGADLDPFYCLETCRASLATNLRQLQARINVLRSAAQGASPPLGLYAVIKASEDVRVSAIRALNEQYRRQAAGRPTPTELSLGTRRSRATLSLSEDALVALDAMTTTTTTLTAQDGGGLGSRLNSPRRSRYLALPMETIVDGIATPVSAGSRRSGLFSEPPSPPLTPTRTEDWQSSRSKRSSVVSTRSRPLSTAALGLFCPEAMRYQLDPARRVTGRACKCGQDLSAQSTGEHLPMNLKEGFQMTPRFVAKSHHVGAGFGCVLCIPNGHVGTFESLASLKDHINTSHDKWQILHDRDLATGC